MELPPPPAVNPEGEAEQEASTADGTQWYDIDFSHHVNYLDRYANGAVTEGTCARAPFGYLTNGKQSLSQQTGSTWTDAEKLAFFGSLARRSRWQPDMIAQDIGSKTQAEVVWYIEALERERRILKVFQRPRRSHLRSQGWISGLAPAAREIKPARIEWEEKCAEVLANREAKEPEVSHERQEQLRKLEAVAAAHRKEAQEMEKSLDKDFAVMRPRRMLILKRAEMALDSATEIAKSEYAARVIGDVLRTCDGNGLKVMDVLVRKTAERVNNPEPLELNHQSSSNPTAPQTLPPPPTSSSTIIEPPTRQGSTVSSAREKQEKERYAYLCRFPVRRLDERHKAEKQMLAKRIRRREVRRARRTDGEAGDGDAPGDSAQNGEAQADRERGGLSATNASRQALPNTGDTPRAENANSVVEGAPAFTRAGKSAPAETTQSNITLDAGSSRIFVSNPANPAVLPLDLTNYRTHRPDTLDKHALKIEQEQYEKARSEYLSRIPLSELTVDQKREKRTLTERVRSRERYRAKAAAKVGLKVEEQVLEMVDAPTADVRLLVLHERKRKRQSDASASVEKRAKRNKRHDEEQEEYDRLMDLNAEGPLSEEDKERMVKLGGRIRSREWRRAQAARALTAGLKREITVEAGTKGKAAGTAGLQDGGVQDGSANLADRVGKEAGSNPEQTTSNAPATEPTLNNNEQDPDALVVEAVKKKIEPAPEPLVESRKSNASPKKRGRPARKPGNVKPDEQPTPEVSVPSRPLEGRSRRPNQFDQSGIGKTRFTQEVKAYHDVKVAELLSFCDQCDSDFEEEFRLFLRANVKAVGNILTEFRYAPQLYAFVDGRRLDLLDLPGIAKMLSHAKEGGEGRTMDLTQLLASLELMETLIRRTIEICAEITTDRRLPESAPATVDQDSMLLSLSLLGQPFTGSAGQQEKGDDAATESPAPPRIPDAEWADMVDPMDGLFEQDPLAEADADAEVEDLRELEVEKQQSTLDRMEDEEFENRLATASLHPEAVVMEDTALPVLENDIFDWTMYERGKTGQWRRSQARVLLQSLPKTWTQGISDEAFATADRDKRVTDIKELRQTLQSTIYYQDRSRWQRIKRLRDPMYRYGGVPRLVDTYKSAAYIDTSDDGGSETETEEEDENEENEKEDELMEEDENEKEDELMEEDESIEKDGMMEGDEPGRSAYADDDPAAFTARRRPDLEEHEGEDDETIDV